MTQRNAWVTRAVSIPASALLATVEPDAYHDEYDEENHQQLTHFGTPARPPWRKN
jgi:hypothetical protein